MTASLRDLYIADFASKPILQQVEIVAQGRPLPLNYFTSAPSSAPPSAIRKTPITSQLFDQVPWLTFCEELKVFYCWPCLLFMPFTFKSPLSRIKPNIDVRDMLVLTNRHEITADHLRSSLKLEMFISKHFPTRLSTQDKVGYNCVVKKNREVLKCIVDAVCCIVGQKKLDSDGKYSFNLVPLKDCQNSLKLLKDCHPRKVDAVDGALELLSLNPGIVNNLVDAMTRSVKMAIKNETKKSTYVSIILSQHGSSRVKSQISTILRYVNRDKVCERFIGFTNKAGIKTREEVTQTILKSIEEYDIAERFLALSLDGEISNGETLKNLIKAVKSYQKFSFFVPWYSHGFGYVLMQTLSVDRQCGLFLKMISGMQEFFRTERHINSLEILLRQKVLHYSPTQSAKWNLHSTFVLYVARYRSYLIEFFGSVINNSKCHKSGIVAQALAFRTFLQDHSTIILLKLLQVIFHGDFDETFNFPLDHNAFDPDRISLFRAKVKGLNFAVIEEALKAEVSRDNKAWKYNMPEIKVTFEKLIEHLYKEIDIRCLHMKSSLGFCDLFDALRDCPIEDVLKDINYDSRFHALQRQMMVEHGKYFNDNDLRTEMNAIKSDPCLCAKTVYDLLEYFAEYNLRSLFPQSYKLVEFILTLPYLPACRQRGGVSKLEDIRKFSYFPEGTGIPSGELSFLNIECEMLQSLRQSSSFYDEVLALLFEVNKTIPLVQI